MDALRSRLSTEGKEGCVEGIWSWDVIPRGDLKERYGTKDSTGRLQTEHMGRRQDRSMGSMVQHQSEETMRNGVHGAGPWLYGTPEERAWRKTAALPSLSSQRRKDSPDLDSAGLFVRTRSHLSNTAVWQQP